MSLDTERKQPYKNLWISLHLGDVSGDHGRLIKRALAGETEVTQGLFLGLAGDSLIYLGYDQVSFQRMMKLGVADMSTYQGTREDVLKLVTAMLEDPRAFANGTSEAVTDVLLYDDDDRANHAILIGLAAMSAFVSLGDEPEEITTILMQGIETFRPPTEPVVTE